jgi:phage gp37-like protein
MIGTFEQAIIDHIQAASDSGALGYKLRHIDSYGNQLDDEVSEFARGAFPAVWVTFSGKRLVQEQDAGTYLWEVTFAVITVTQNRRNEKARRRGSSGKVGSYQIVRDMEALLAGQYLNLDLHKAITPGDVTSLVNGKIKSKNISIYAQRFTIQFWASYDTWPVHADNFATFHADFDIPPHGNVTTPLPAAESDASDTVPIPT